MAELQAAIATSTKNTTPINWPNATLPKANGRPGTDADWQALMGEVETLGVELGEPGFFYLSRIWDLGLDSAPVTRLLPQP